LIENCTISGFRFDGVHIEGDDEVPHPNLSKKNANGWAIHHCEILRNGRHGLYVMGKSANAGFAVGVDFTQNCRWGVYERSQLGNTYVGCHTSFNGHQADSNDPASILGGAYRTKTQFPELNVSDIGARNVFLGCYSEGGQGPSDLSDTTLVLWGDQAAHYTPSTRAAIVDFGGINELPVRGPVVHKIRRIVSIDENNPGLNSAQRILADESVILVDAAKGGLRIFLPDLAGQNTDITGRQFTIKRVDFKRAVSDPDRNVFIRAQDAPIDTVPLNTDLPLAPRSAITLKVLGASYQLLNVVELPRFQNPDQSLGGGRNA
jgi:hypothetical protein